MSGNPWHKRYHSDALNGYMSLSLEERGAYSTILDLLYDRGEPILDNERLLAGYLGVSIRKTRAVIEALIAKGKIHRTGDGRISNSRFEKERENELKTSRKRAENGSKGGRARHENSKKDNETNGDAQAELEPGSSLNQKPEARSQIEDRESKLSLAHPPSGDRAKPVRFSEFWDAYPHRGGLKKGRALAEKRYAAAVKRGVPEETILAGAKAAHTHPDVIRGFARDPTTWLNQEGWRDEFGATSGSASAGYWTSMGYIPEAAE